MLKTLAIACHKGGVGKTTTAAALGAALAARGKRTLLVDLDAQKNLTTTFMDESPERTVFDAFAEAARRKGGPGLPIYGLRDNLDIVPASQELCTMDMSYGKVTGKDLLLRMLLDPLRRRYDVAVIDTPAQLGTATANALAAADQVLVPLNSDAYAVGGISQLADLIADVRAFYNPAIKVMGLLVTKYNGRRIVDRQVVTKLREEYGDLVFSTVIRENAAIVQAPLCHADIFSYEPDSRGAQDYNTLCDEVLRRLKIKP